MFGNGVWTYITLSITSGAPSWPRSTPVEKVHATCSLPTLPELICLRFEWRVLAESPLGITQSFGLFDILISSSLALAPPVANTASAPTQVVSRYLRITSPPCDFCVGLAR